MKKKTVKFASVNCHVLRFKKHYFKATSLWVCNGYTMQVQTTLNTVQVFYLTTLSIATIYITLT
jgi:hypothetical protein